MPVRRPAVAGQFYTRDPAALRAQVEEFIEGSGVAPAPGRVAAVMAPHAGYAYSGQTAGCAFARVAGKKTGRVVLLGRSHRYRFDGAQVWTSGAFETPLGRVPVEAGLAAELAEAWGGGGHEAHLLEHGLEVELPFLQVALTDFAIVPVLFGSEPSGWHIRAGERLAALLGPDDFVVISTDLSHYLSESEANALDQASLQGVLRRNPAALARESAQGACSLCGATAVVAGMACANAVGADDWRILDYRTSGAASGDFSRVVGYGAISMECSSS